MTTQHSPLARLLVAVYVLLVVYASLYPLTGWREANAPVLEFLRAPWPPYDTRFDIVVNVLAYLPLGALVVLGLYPRVQSGWALLCALLGAAALSLGLETVQNFLPQRHASTLDLTANTLGAFAGGLLGLAFAPWLLHAGPLRRLRSRLFKPGAAADLGLVLTGMWLFIQLNPATLLFGAGDLRDLFSAPEGPGHAPALFIGVEALTAASGIVALSLLLSLITASERFVRTACVVLLFLALAIKTAAFAIVMRAENIFAWLTPGALQGLAAGVIGAALMVGLPRRLRLVFAALLIMGAAILVNLAPANPYLAATLAVWRQGHFLNFNGLTRLVAAAWPFAAVAYLIYFAAVRSSER